MVTPFLSDEDKVLFRQMMRGVNPLAQPQKKIKERQNIASVSRQLQVCSLPKKVTSHYFLSDAYYEPVDSNTELSYSQSGIIPKRVQQLKKGSIRWEACLDLHGLQVDSARDTFCRFIEQSKKKNYRCILIIHGKGSYGGEPPILKNLVNHWLKQISEILAFHSALACDGGSGAVYVLLKRRHNAESNL